MGLTSSRVGGLLSHERRSQHRLGRVAHAIKPRRRTAGLEALVLQAITTLGIFVGILAAIAAVADWIAVARRITPLEYAAKPTATLAIGFLAVAAAPGNLRGTVIVAFSLCLVGDILLMLAKDRFVSGLAAFLLGHAAFVAVFVQIGLVEIGSTQSTLSIATVAVLVAAVASRIVPHAYRLDSKIGWAVAVYALTIFGMFVAAVGTGQPALGIGAFVFMVSDALIGFRRFSRLAKPGNVAIMVLYHSALTLLAFGIAQ